MERTGATNKESSLTSTDDVSSTDKQKMLRNRKQGDVVEHEGAADLKVYDLTNKNPCVQTSPRSKMVKSHSEEIKLRSNNNNEQGIMTTSFVVDIPVEQLQTNSRQLYHTEIARNDMCCAGDVSDLSLHRVRDGHLKISQFSLDKNVAGNSKKNKLLILDVNGLLVDFVNVNDTRITYRQDPEPDFFLKGKKVYNRPFCDDFLQFCFDRFHVGVWSSTSKGNVDEAITFLMGNSASKLLFCWNHSHCTRTQFTTVENKEKPLVLKELRKLWEKEDPDLPWEKGEFNESNTLLLDDSPYKALLNPKHTAIFPCSYRYYHTRDSELGPRGDVRVYLEGLITAEDVQKHISENPFGQRPIRETNPSRRYYSKVIEAVKCRQGRMTS
ncbi:hypothetical protein Fmac_018637 [Flemingia macrophylla]|uniref:Mitochondrial import inner membrane translocase subunit TIM50 n=1 Tax=Flemingia macrophylla TaxID=520843 RepID=A0ABD1M5M6_9FABA